MPRREDLAAELIGTFWTFLGIGLFILVGTWLLLKLRSRWQEDADSATTSHEMLTQIRDLHRQGDLSEEEYRSIKGRLVGRLDGSRPGPSPTGSAAPDGPDTPDTPDEPDGTDGSAGAGQDAATGDEPPR